MTMLTLRIDPSDPATGWNGRWFVEGQPAGGPISVVGPAARSMADLSQRFLRLFEQGGPALFATWFEPAWPAIKAQLASTGSHQLVVQSAEHDVLNLPWELVELDPNRPVGCDAAWSLCRSPLTGQLE